MGRRSPKTGKPMYLVKWKTLGYEECTWEDAKGLASTEDRAHIAAFEARHRAPPVQPLPPKGAKGARQPMSKEAVEALEWKGGNTLREHQVPGLGPAVWGCGLVGCRVAGVAGRGTDGPFPFPAPPLDRILGDLAF